MFNETYTPRTMQKVMSRTPLGDIMSPLQGSPLSRRIVEPTINEMFGPNTKPSRELMARFHEILEYNDGKRVMHKVGRFLGDRYTHRNRWVRAMRENHGADAAHRRTHRPQFRRSHGAAVRRGHP